MQISPNFKDTFVRTECPDTPRPKFSNILRPNVLILLMNNKYINCILQTIILFF